MPQVCILINFYYKYIFESIFFSKDTGIIKCGLSEKTLTNLKQTTEQFGKTMTSMFLSSKLVLQTVAVSDG